MAGFKHTTPQSPKLSAPGIQGEQGLRSAVLPAFGEDHLDREGHDRLFACTDPCLYDVAGATETSLWVKALAAKLNDLSLSPRTPWWEERTHSINCPLTSQHGCGI